MHIFSFSKIARVAGYSNSAQLAGNGRNTQCMQKDYSFNKEGGSIAESSASYSWNYSETCTLGMKGSWRAAVGNN